MEIQVIRVENRMGDQSIIGVFDDAELANKTYDALEQHGDKAKKYFIDTYKLNEIKKGN